MSFTEAYQVESLDRSSLVVKRQGDWHQGRSELAHTVLLFSLTGTTDFPRYTTPHHTTPHHTTPHHTTPHHTTPHHTTPHHTTPHHTTPHHTTPQILYNDICANSFHLLKMFQEIKHTHARTYAHIITWIFDNSQKLVFDLNNQMCLSCITFAMSTTYPIYLEVRATTGMVHSGVTDLLLSWLSHITFTRDVVETLWRPTVMTWKCP